MPSFLPFFTQPSRLWLSAVCLLAGLGSPASAVPPKAPANLKLTSTLLAAAVEDGKTVMKTGRYFKLEWEDKSLDETGFRIEARLGNIAAFESIGTVSPNETQYLRAFEMQADTLLQFRVQAFKYNGTKVESAASNFVEHVFKAQVGSLTGPSLFEVSPITITVGDTTVANDGKLRFKYNDRSTNEIYHQILCRKANVSGATYLPMTLNGFQLFTAEGNKDLVLNHGLIPGQAYDFAIRAARGASTTLTENNLYNYTALVPATGTITIPPLDKPTGFYGQALNEYEYKLQWEDNSDNETDYKIEYNLGSGWTALTRSEDFKMPNYTSFTINTGPGFFAEWRVTAVYTNGSTTVVSDPSDVFTGGTPFKGPAGLTATTSGTSGKVELTWQDLADSENAYEIYARPVGSSDWKYSQSMLADSTRATVSYARYDYDEPTETYIPVPFSLDVEYEFQVKAGYGTMGAVSAPTNTATAYARHGFTSRGYHPAKLGQAFSYQMVVSNDSARSSWGVTGLPAGLGFTNDGKIAGTPQESGVFICPMTVSYSSGPPVTLPLTLRVLPPEASPVSIKTIEPVTLGTDVSLTIPLADKFKDPDVKKAVKLRTSRGDINIVLYSELTPLAVNNFMGYVNNKAYDGVIFHRSVPTFVVQGGAFARQDYSNSFASLLKRPSPYNEPGISNIRGTVAAAKVGDYPDSATHDFFFSLEDNSLKTGIELDNQNGGFTVFGRVAGPGMTVVDSIAALPIGAYTNDTATGGTDRRAVVDGYLSEMSAIPMNVPGTIAPATLDVRKTVQMEQAVETPVLTYETESASASTVSANIVDGALVLKGGKLAGTTTVTVTARDLDGNPVPQTFNVNVVKGLKPVIITKHPVAVAAAENSKVSLSVTATGTNLLYQWRKNQVDIPGATAKAYSIAKLLGEHEGTYDVVVRNEMMTVTSSPATVNLRALPTAGALPVETVVELGSPLVLEATATGLPAPALSWLKDGKAVSGQKLAKLNIPVTKLTDGGNYVVRATNTAGKSDSAAGAVIIVDKTDRLVTALSGKAAVMKAQASGPPGLEYRWKRGNVVLTEDYQSTTESVTGTQTATLTVKSLEVLPEAVRFTCQVRRPGGTFVETGAWKFAVVAKPQLTGTTLPDAYAGISYDHTLLSEDNIMIASLSVSGLPAGLKADTTTGRITGITTSPGVYALKVTGKNVAGSSAPATFTLTVRPTPEAVVGTFTGRIGASEALNANKGGRVDMTVTDGGAISGKLTQGKEVLNFTGVLKQVPDSVYSIGKASIVRKGLPTIELEFSSIGISGYSRGGEVSGVISVGNQKVGFDAYRNIFNDAWNPNYLTGNFNIRLNVAGDAINQESVPQGTGYLKAAINNAGTVTMSGRLADGTTLTSSSFLGAQNQFLIHQSLYKGTGTVVGLAGLSLVAEKNLPDGSVQQDFRVDGAVLWARDPQPAASERLYKAGFNLVPLAVLGMTYREPAQYILSLPPPGNSANASISFTNGGLAAASLNPNASMAVSYIAKGNGNSATAYGANPGKTQLTSLDKKNGLFSGSFELLDTPSKRTAKFYGMIIPQIPTVLPGSLGSDYPAAEMEGVAGVGAGSFLLNQLPSSGPPATTLTTSKILSGAVSFSPVSITITDQPDSQSVNPGSAVTFTVVASAPSGQITYQWRKDGLSISGATNASYAITSVNSSHKGKYDVVLTTPYARLVSAQATLALNQAVTKPTITRSPATDPVAVGALFTLTASATGSGTLTYQWFKGTEMIPGATGASYTISSAVLTDESNYSVRVSGLGEQTSEAHYVKVRYPITAVTATRTPNTETVNHGTVVVFSIQEITGSNVAPYTYQWTKNGENIAGQTNATLTINFVNEDVEGVYAVKVKNEDTAVAVASNAVPLMVNNGVFGVVVTRTPAGPVGLGMPVTFNVAASGPDLQYQWRKNGEAISGATSATYTINSVAADNAGNYSVLVSNTAVPDGVASSPVALTIQPVITQVTLTGPASSTVNLGATVMFQAEPNVTGEFTYQWFRNEEEITGRTEATLVITGAQESDSGSYRVVARNDSTPGGVSSQAVSITVVVP